MKKNYQPPVLRVVVLQHKRQLLAVSINSVNAVDTGITYVGGGSGAARGREDDGNDWDE